MTEEFKKGDRVEWETSNGKTVGEIKKKLTQPTDIKSHHVAASEENPQYLVESEKTGKEAAHKPASLEKSEES
ncbi:MAG: DUF2945 domain-containing protein [Drouetiella hepatica Uher 2000/2452]|jgi:hypothetical protein|uniref:DUF2945 domain-containing protein n=1 Tax=Drouetiella hepatica Uher 2000/2452 TaxID=904376 RepID=A0A951Q9P3_9CYAN|nr:DUF2945 domain-containing protein [Drouetiella hepatica Uher 2000/2452]